MFRRSRAASLLCFSATLPQILALFGGTRRFLARCKAAAVLVKSSRRQAYSFPRSVPHLEEFIRALRAGKRLSSRENRADL
jgi:hypothetical protein